MAKPQDHDELVEKGEQFIEKKASARKSLFLPN
jgi:hypothetical protein